MQTLSELPLVAGAMPAQLLRQVRRRHKALQRLRKLRQQARDEIERLIQFLDDSDLDPDLEADGADEPSLGFQECFPGRGGGTYSTEPDLEVDDSDDEPDVDDEPSLGACGVIDQSLWGKTAPSLQRETDLEDEHDGGEPENEHGDGDPDAEPSLGWTLDGELGNDRDREVELRSGHLKGARERKGLCQRPVGVTAVSPGYGNWKRLGGLSDNQARALRHRLDVRGPNSRSHRIMIDDQNPTGLR